MDSSSSPADGSLSARDIVTDIERTSLPAQQPDLSGVQVTAALLAVCASSVYDAGQTCSHICAAHSATASRAKSSIEAPNALKC